MASGTRLPPSLPPEEPHCRACRAVDRVSCTRPRSVSAAAFRAARLRPGRVGGTRLTCLPLLPPGPDGVHRQHVAPGPAFNVGRRGRLQQKADLSTGIPPRVKRFSGYRAPLVPRLARYICHCLAPSIKTATRPLRLARSREAGIFTGFRGGPDFVPPIGTRIAAFQGASSRTHCKVSDPKKRFRGVRVCYNCPGKHS